MDNDINNFNNNMNNNKQTNIYAILGIIFSFFFSIAGLILSIIGLKKSKELNNGKGLSIAGIVISSIRMIFTIIMVFIIFIGFFSFGTIETPSILNKVKEHNKCELAYNCTPNEDGTYTCSYATTIEIEQIICNEYEVQDKINKEMEEIYGTWLVARVKDEMGGDLNPAKYYGFLEEGNENKKFELVLNSDGTSYNGLAWYEDENDLNGTYKIENDKIYITNNNNKTDIVDIKYDENNEMYLVLHDDGVDVYLYKEYNLYTE